MSSLKYLSAQEYINLNPSITGSDLEKILYLRKTSISMQNSLAKSNNLIESNQYKNNKNYAKIIKNQIIYKANLIIKAKNELFFNDELKIDENIILESHKLDSLISYQAAFINGKKLKIEIFNEEFSLYNYKDKIAYLSKKAAAPSICEELYHSLQYFYTKDISNELAEQEAFNVRRILFPEDAKNKARIMPESCRFKIMQLDEIKKGLNYVNK